MLTLLELNRLVKHGLKQAMPGTYWVQAEISECKTHFSGHCYLELIQKKDDKDTLCAKAKATIWATTWQELGSSFAQKTGTPLAAGMQILAEVAVEFHELYGFNLVIKDLDPSYTLGNQVLRRQEILKRLESEGVIDQNKELRWPTLPQRVAVVSSPAAAGFQDFTNHLHGNEFGFVYYTALFPATMQGEGAVASIVDALDRIIECGVPFDVVVLIRGGGAVADLSCFDAYNLCFYATQYPLPLLTGLGHDKDNAILDRVAHTSVKTPTAAAECLIASLSEQAWALDARVDRLIKRTTAVLETQRRLLHALPGRLANLVQNRLVEARLNVERRQMMLQQRTISVLAQAQQNNARLLAQLTHRCQVVISQERQRTQLLEQSLLSYSPAVMLQRGFSLTLHQGKVVRNSNDVPVGAVLETRLAEGYLTSIVHSKHQTDEP